MSLEKVVLESMHRSEDEVKKEEAGSGDALINGINVLRLPARDKYAFGLQLLDVLFTKEKLASSLLFKSKKSEKPGLDKARVQQLMTLVDKKFGNSWDLKTLTQKANQNAKTQAQKTGDCRAMILGTDDVLYVL